MAQKACALAAFVVCFHNLCIYIYICENAFEVIAGQPCEPVLFLQLAIDALGMFMLPPHCRYA